jgi:hypothetical protein
MARHVLHKIKTDWSLRALSMKIFPRATAKHANDRTQFKDL